MGLDAVSRASQIVDERIRAMAEDRDARGQTVSTSAPLYIGMPASYQEAYGYVKSLTDHVMGTIEKGEAGPEEAVAGALQHALVVGMLVGRE